MTGIRLLQLAGLAVATAAVCAASVLLFRGSDAFAAVWPANAIILTFMIRWSDRRADQALALVVALFAMSLSGLACGRPLGLTLGFAVANAVEITIAAWALRGVATPLARMRDLARFAGFGVLGGALASATVATGLVFVTGVNTDAPDAFLRWFLADGLGLAIWAPFGLSLGKFFVPATLETRRLVLGVASQAAVIAAALAIFSQDSAPLLFAVFPFVTLAVLANRNAGAVVALGSVTVIAVVATAQGHGPANLAGPDQAIFLVQGTLAALVATMLPLSVLLRRLDAYASLLEKDNVRLETLNHNKTRLLAHVSHEIRSPLSGVVSIAQILQSGALGEMTPRQHEMLDKIAASGVEIETLARDLTDTAAIQAGKVRITIADVSVDDALSEALNAARIHAADFNPTFLILGGGSAGLTVRADPLRLKQILVNLLMNGAKYGGRPPVVRIEVKAAGGKVRFEVSDNGKGIDPEHQGRLFADFERLGAEKTEVQGFGLGLALSMEFARLQDGAMGAGAGPGSGALFWLELPEAAEDRAQVA